MTTFSPLSVAMVLDIGARIVGLTFIWTGAIKAIAPGNFRQHLSRLGWIRQSLLAPAVIAAAAFEAGWGAALVVRLAPQAVLPLTAILLAVFSFISWWGVRSGKTTDCGCYGGYIQPSITQSVGLNSLFIVVVLASWLLPDGSGTFAGWKLAVAVGLAVVAAIYTWIGQRHEMKYGKPLVNTNPLEVGAKWKKSWAASEVTSNEDEVFVSYLGPDCPYCIKWVGFLNAMDKSPTLPRVVGVLGAPRDRVARFVEERGIGFRTVTISQSLMARLAPAVPVTVRVASGKVSDIWVGAMPPELYGRFRDAFFPQAAAAADANKDSSGLANSNTVSWPGGAPLE